MMRNPDKIYENDFAIIKMPSGNEKIVQLKRDEQVLLGKFGKFQANDLINHYFGVPYEIYDKEKIRRVENVNYLLDFDIDPLEETSNNNKGLQDDSSVQQLSQKQIEELKKQSLDGEFGHKELIGKIIESNQTFQEKTEFSKAKYIKRKMKKFSKIFVPIRPTPKAFTEFYRLRGNEKIREMRMDTLSQMLTFTNIRPGSNVLVCDDTAGLVGSAILERMGGDGKVYFFHDGQSPNLEIVRYCNFSQKIIDSYVPWPWHRFQSEPTFPCSQDPESIARSEERKKKYVSQKEYLEQGGFDALVIASKFDPKEVIDRLIPYVATSGTVLCYSYRKELLLEAYNHVRMDRDFCNTQLTESWLREYQVPVFSSGTHPNMMTSGSGGFLFTATKTTSEGVEIVKPPMKKRKAQNKSKS